MITSRYRIVLGNSSLDRYLQGGGRWMVRLQFLLGLNAIHDDDKSDIFTAYALLFWLGDRPKWINQNDSFVHRTIETPLGS